MSTRKVAIDSGKQLSALPVKKKGKVVKAIIRYKFLYLLVFPAVFFTFVFQYLPMLGVVMAFQDIDIWTLGKPNILQALFGSPFVGFKHFVSLFTLSEFRDATIRTLWYGITSICITFPFPIALALMFNEVRNRAFKRITQTISYLPHFLTWIAVVGLIYTIFASDGLYNEIRRFVTGPDTQPDNPLVKVEYFLPILIGSSIWKNIGWNSIIYLAAITSIDPQQYEAAIIDGCNKLKQVFYITLPGMMPTVMIILIFSVGQLVNANFEQVFGLQNMFTQEQTEVINTIVYRSGITRGEYSISTAFGFAQGLVTMVLVIAANKIARKVSNVGIY